MSKVDWKVTLKPLYNPSKKEAAVVDVPPLNFLMIDGHGDPNNSMLFKEAVQTLFSMSYTIKFMIKKAAGIDYAVMPLEGLWWVENITQFDFDDKSNWLWTLMIMQPSDVTADHVIAARQKADDKAPLRDSVRLESYHEGTAVQIMHIGPFSAEKPTIKRLHRFIEDSGAEIAGKHHEIYLTDMTRTAPDKLKTVIRYPIRKKA